MKRTKLAALAILACALAAVPAFAGPKDIPASVIPKETVTLQVYDQLANYSGIQAGWFADVMLKKFNVKLNIISQPAGSGVFQTRMASGSLGDLVIWGNDQEEYVNAYKAGMLFNWDDEKLLDSYGPYIKASMPFALEKNRKISAGKLTKSILDEGQNQFEVHVGVILALGGEFRLASRGGRPWPRAGRTSR